MTNRKDRDVTQHTRDKEHHKVDDGKKIPMLIKSFAFNFFLSIVGTPFFYARLSALIFQPIAFSLMPTKSA